MRVFRSFAQARESLTSDLIDRSYEVKAPRWQGIDISDKPEMRTREVLNVSFQVPLQGLEDLDHWKEDIEPNLPWADVHFYERVGGLPLNPPPSYKLWPWAHSAEKFLDERGQFDHTYPERFWPKHAGRVQPFEDAQPNHGIRYEYGDLDDLVTHLANDPLSRQAYLPIWFPEDGTSPGRKPCTLGYHFINRHDYLHTTYYTRSCDFTRHWEDDCYLAVSLALWILDRLRERDDRWKAVKPGMFTFHCVSLHLFKNDFLKLRQKHAGKED